VVRRFLAFHNLVFGKTWPLWLAGLVIGFLSVVRFVWDKPWGVVAGIRNWGDWFFNLIGVYTKPIESPVTSTESLTVAGLILGSFASALAGREFGFRIPPFLEAVKGAIAGVFMGIGAALARGCNVGGFFEAIASFSLGGLAMAAGLIPGVYIGLKYLLWEMERFPAKGYSVPRGGQRSGFDWTIFQPWLGYGILLLGVVSAFFYASSAYTKSGVVLVLSMAMGVVFHRARLCFVAAFRDPFMTGDSQQTKAMLIATMVATVGYSMVKWSGIRPETSYVVNTFGLGGLLGGFVFGIGMVLAGGCGSGTLWRFGEGQMKLWIVLVTFMFSNSILRYYMEVTGYINRLGLAIFIPDLITYKWALIATLAFLGLWYLLVDWNEERQVFVIK